MLQPPIRIGTRKSLLARTQSGWVQRRVALALGAAEEDAEGVAPLTFISTEGDRVQDRRLLEIGGKALFTKEIEQALLERRIDLAVHSMKDVPAETPAGLVIAAIPEREDPRDAFISHVAGRLEDLPQGACLGTASLRRQAQALAVRPDLLVVMLRGNVDTRLARLRNGDFDAIFLAAAGLNRLGLGEAITSLLDPVAAPPAPGQGALAIQCRAEDAEAPWLASLNHAPTALCVAAERGALEALEGSCRTAVGAYARLTDAGLELVTEALTTDGAARWREAATVPASATREEAFAMGAEAGRKVKAAAGDRLA
ncbi:MAG TPA: hydroxymethylbilane synthase, partial [Caulobacteraceae bacterium]